MIFFAVFFPYILEIVNKTIQIPTIIKKNDMTNHTIFWAQFGLTQKQNIVLGCKKSIV